MATNYPTQYEPTYTTTTSSYHSKQDPYAPAYGSTVSSSRPRGRSFTSRYVPDNYPIPPPPRRDESEAYFAQPPQYRTQPEKSVAFEPPRPEQYRPPQDTRGVPPAQLPPNYQDPRYVEVDDYDQRGYNHRRHGSEDPQYSARSHSSSYGHHDRRRYSDFERDRPSRRHHHRRREHRRHSSDRDSTYDKSLKRRDTPRGYGSSLFAVIGGIKDALKLEF